jgi:hypothetical protein
MATERVVEREAAPAERVTYVEKGGSGMGAVIIGIALLALVAIVAFFLLQANRNDAIETQAVTSAASSVAESAGQAAGAVGEAAGQVAESVNPE